MQYIILIGDQSFNLDSVKNVKHGDARCHIDESRSSVDFGEDYIIYNFVADFINEYTKKERRKIPFGNPNFIIMAYKSIDRVRQVLKQNDFPKGIYVDDDSLKLNIQPIEDFIKSLDNGTSPLLKI